MMEKSSEWTQESSELPAPIVDPDAQATLMVNDRLCNIYGHATRGLYHTSALDLWTRQSHKGGGAFHSDLSAHHVTMACGQPAIMVSVVGVEAAHGGRQYLALGHPVMPLAPAVHPP